MSEIAIRSSLAGLEEYEVETIEAKIIVNANESNYPVPASIQQEIAWPGWRNMKLKR